MTPNTPSAPEGAALDTQTVAGKGKRKRRKRTAHAATMRKIHAKARERQAAWKQTGQKDVTERLTQELDALYADLRGERNGHKGETVFRGDPAGRLA